MSAKRKQVVRGRARRASPSVVLTFGENMNDARAMAELIIAANPSLENRVQARPKPVSLTRTAGPQAQRQWVAEIRKVVAGFQAAQGPVAAVVVHRDADAHDPEATVQANLSETLSVLDNGFPAVPVQTTEAWWFLFPAAVESVRPRTWRGILQAAPGDVEQIVDPKHKLKQLTRRKGAEYAESDSPAIAKAVREGKMKPSGVCASYDRFVAMAAALPA